MALAHAIATGVPWATLEWSVNRAWGILRMPPDYSARQSSRATASPRQIVCGTEAWPLPSHRRIRCDHVHAIRSPVDVYEKDNRLVAKIDCRVGETTMKVKDLMTTDVKTCTSHTTLAEAAHLMWDGDCGILPVVDDGELTGVVTDRDMYIALATQNARASRLNVGAVATKELATCAPEDDVHAVLATMTHARVRRVPVAEARCWASSR